MQYLLVNNMEGAIMKSRLFFLMVSFISVVCLSSLGYTKAKATISGCKVTIKQGTLNGTRSMIIKYKEDNGDNEVDKEASEVLQEFLVSSFIQKKNADAHVVELLDWELEDIEHLKDKKVKTPDGEEYLIDGINSLHNNAAAFRATVLLLVKYRGQEQEIRITKEFITQVPKNGNHVQFVFEFQDALATYFSVYNIDESFKRGDYLYDPAYKLLQSGNYKKNVKAELDELMQLNKDSYVIELIPKIIGEEIAVNVPQANGIIKTEYFSQITIKIPGSSDSVYEKKNKLKDVMVYTQDIQPDEIKFHGLLLRVQQKGTPWKFSIKKDELFTEPETIIGNITGAEFDILYARLLEQEMRKLARTAAVPNS